MRVLVSGMSARAAAASAAYAGFDVTAIDAFADLDQHRAVRALSLRRDFGVGVTAHAAARASRTIECDAVSYLSSFENHPSAVGTLASGRALWGNRPEVLRLVRNPHLLSETLRRRGCTAPYVASGWSRGVDPAHRWLAKPIASGGGHGVKEWREGLPLSRRCYLQQFIEGTPGSIVFVAAGGRAVPLGVTRQLIGEQAFGSSGYGYGGNILAPAGDPQFEDEEALVAAACDLARVVTEEFGLVGVNGIDFIARGGIPWAMEVNPRWCASMELVELAYGVSVFDVHATACARGVLPDFDLARSRDRVEAVGKAIVFARHDVVAGDTPRWLDDSTIRDVPHAGERMAAGEPVCTVFATGANGAACRDALTWRAKHVYNELAAWAPHTTRRYDSPCVSS